jgi:transposase
MLLRRGWIWNGSKKAWGQGHRLWLRSLRFEQPADQVVFDNYLQAIDQVEQRLRTLEQQIEAVSQLPAYAEATGALRCFRGIDTLTAMGLVAELHDFMRFDSAHGLMAFLGLVPSEFSSADSERRGAITKAGNRHARRLLIEAAWHYRHQPNPQGLKRRRQGQPAEVIALADKAMYRLNRRFHRMLAKGKPAGKTVVAVARELAGFVWAALHSKAA